MNVIQCHLKSFELPQSTQIWELFHHESWSMMVQTAFHQTWNCSYDLLNWLLTICFIGVLSRTKQKHRRRFASKPIVYLMFKGHLWSKFQVGFLQGDEAPDAKSGKVRAEEEKGAKIRSHQPGVKLKSWRGTVWINFKRLLSSNLSLV